MSRVGKKAIVIPDGVSVEQKGGTIKLSGPKGTVQMDCNPAITVKIEKDRIELINPNGDVLQCRAVHGTTRALLNNMVVGVSRGFEKRLQVFGTGYSVKTDGSKLILTVGFCNPVMLDIPDGVKVNITTPAAKGNDTPAVFSLSGCDRQKLGQFAAEIRKVRPPEPYQGKGIRYADEIVRRKVGKAFASGGA